MTGQTLLARRRAVLADLQRLESSLEKLRANVKIYGVSIASLEAELDNLETELGKRETKSAEAALEMLDEEIRGEAMIPELDDVATGVDELIDATRDLAGRVRSTTWDRFAEAIGRVR